MSVLIKGMDMPKSCEECDLVSTVSDWFHCPVGKRPDGRVLDLENNMDEFVYTKSRHPKCPLIPIPEKHGRLIDADALSKKDINLADFPYNFIKVAPTIIEAEE